MHYHFIFFLFSEKIDFLLEELGLFERFVWVCQDWKFSQCELFVSVHGHTDFSNWITELPQGLPFLPPHSNCDADLEENKPGVQLLFVTESARFEFVKMFCSHLRGCHVAPEPVPFF